MSNCFAHLAHELEPAPDRAVTPKMEALSERKFHSGVIFAAATLTNKWLLRTAPKEKAAETQPPLSSSSKRPAPYLALFTNWMQSPWFLKVVPSERTVRVHPPFLH